MAAGFLSVLPVLGLAAVASAEQGGFRTPVPGWNAGGTAAEGQGGFRTPVPGWNAGGTTAAEQGGYKSLMGFWMGGASGGTAIIVDDLPEKLGGPRDYGKAWREQLIREDGEILMFIAAWTETIQ